jgi:hypothetical protein
VQTIADIRRLKAKREEIRQALIAKGYQPWQADLIMESNGV